MSTHKWLCNVKTCGIIRYGEKTPAPNPPAISFGWDLPDKDQDLDDPSLEETQSRFLWIGMLDSYIAYIALAKALQVCFYLILPYFARCTKISYSYYKTLLLELKGSIR